MSRGKGDKGETRRQREVLTQAAVAAELCQPGGYKPDFIFLSP